MKRTDHHHFRFHGGLILPENKSQSTRLPILKAPLPEQLVVPVQQHIGEPPEVLVRSGDLVTKGQMLARAREYVSVPVHAPTSGRIIAVEDRPIPHPSGRSALCVVIEVDGEDRWGERTKPLEDVFALHPNELRSRIREAGIVGLGGAGFPSFIKLNPGPDKPIELLILNGAECEPYISCDDTLMRERAYEIVQGLRILRHTLSARRCLIGIEDNKLAAIDAMRAALADAGDEDLRLDVVPTRYPAGGEKQLIQSLTGREVPSQGLPADIGVVCHNVGTAQAVYRALVLGEPLLSRIVTVTGGGVREPRNLEVLIGTPISHLVEVAGGYQADASRLLLGGPMMGFALPNDALPIIKTSNCILVGTEQETPPPPMPMPCIRCGECATVCPARLLPQQLYWHTRAHDFDKVQDYNLFDCIECGCCAFVCPSHIPLVQYYRFAKTEIWAQEKERQQADTARMRHEFRIERLEREKQERAQRLKQKKKALKKPASTGGDPKKAAIEAALARVKAKKEGGHAAPRNVDNLTPEQQKKIAEIDARRRAEGTQTPHPTEDDQH